MQFMQEIPPGRACPPGAAASPTAETDGAPVRLQRSLGLARVSYKLRGPATVLDQVHQSGCCKLRFPRAYGTALPEAVFINTAGGLTDGDDIGLNASWAEGTCATITTQAAERIYRARGRPARVANRLSVGVDATAFWLPQETILYDGGRLERGLEADIARGGRLLACESIVFGRTAMGETVTSGSLLDTWRLRREGRLVFADGLALSGDMQANLDSPAVAGGARAVASVVLVAEDAGTLVDPVRALLAGAQGRAGCSCNGDVLVIRLLGATGAEMRRDLVMLLRLMLERIGQGGHGKAPARLPRVWSF